VGRTRSTLEETAQLIEQAGGTAHVSPTDITSEHEVDRMVESALQHWATIDVLVNNAALFDEPPFFEHSSDTFRRIVDTNLTGTFLVSQRVAREMAKRRHGAIVHISSIDSLGADGPYSAYTATKCGVTSLARTMAVELSDWNIRVNCVAPGFVNTDMTHKITPKEIMDYMLHSFARVPLKRLVEADEVAAAVSFLASDDASAITGINLLVDCGVTCNLYIEETLPAPTIKLGNQAAASP
jgi:NAD(P)-dependent dehydrogenase (short-subunit alcohol dehydrogenase family)